MDLSWTATLSVCSIYKQKHLVECGVIDRIPLILNSPKWLPKMNTSNPKPSLLFDYMNILEKGLREWLPSGIMACSQDHPIVDCLRKNVSPYIDVCCMLNSNVGLCYI